MQSICLCKPFVNIQIKSQKLVNVAKAVNKLSLAVNGKHLEQFIAASSEHFDQSLAAIFKHFGQFVESNQNFWGGLKQPNIYSNIQLTFSNIWPMNFHLIISSLLCNFISLTFLFQNVFFEIRIKRKKYFDLFLNLEKNQKVKLKVKISSRMNFCLTNIILILSFIELSISCKLM